MLSRRYRPADGFRTELNESIERERVRRAARSDKALGPRILQSGDVALRPPSDGRPRIWRGQVVRRRWTFTFTSLLQRKRSRSRLGALPA